MEKLSIRKDVGRIHLGGYHPEFLLSGSPGLPWDPVLSEPGCSAFLLILCDPSQPLTDVLFVQSGRISFCFRWRWWRWFQGPGGDALASAGSFPKHIPTLTFTFSF